MRDLTFRDATAADYGAFARLFEELGVDDPNASYEVYVASTMPSTFFAERGGEPIGYAYYRLLDGGAHVAQIATAKSARRQGVGRALMAEMATRLRALGATWWQLNVKPDNVAALGLYESFGMRRDKRSWALWIDWADVVRQPAPFVADVRVLDPSEDLAWEKRLATPPGVLAMARKLKTRVFKVLEPDGLISFDVAFPGAFPFYAPNAPAAFSLLQAVRPDARPELATIGVTFDENEPLKDALLAAGARLRFEMLRMYGEL